MDIRISKVVEAEDERILIFPEKEESMFKFIYRAARGVTWDNELKCFASTNPNNWDNWNYLNWYRQIHIAVREELGKRLQLDNETVFEGRAENFIEKIRQEDIETQKWIDENFT